MKISKRKRSSKSEPVVEAAEAADATAAAVSAEPAAAADVVANDSVVATEAVAATEAGQVATEAVAATEAGQVATEAVTVTEPAVATEAVASEPAAAASEPVVVLAANCSVKDAATLKTSLCAVSNETVAVTVDASAVERVDTATMQLLCAFVRDRSSRNQSVLWRGQSRALHDAVRLLGVGRLLGFEQAKGVAA